ncbi:hypothetical protein FYJ24_02080 [Actinomycetaceae bacterium WB03_NA08]|uniref:Uncharacterized protein n=1 Tax=Scrofimicrobium canadense TaxID=2652290 RepID=A0A6N7VPB1_9ACTO|nr:hypothetical protein [Scrofimicrobium canadense]MSS83569.1 hypothetical protein [Scrofimicrobium canadense]
MAMLSLGIAVFFILAVGIGVIVTLALQQYSVDQWEDRIKDTVRAMKTPRQELTPVKEVETKKVSLGDLLQEMPDVEDKVPVVEKRERVSAITRFPQFHSVEGYQARN